MTKLFLVQPGSNLASNQLSLSFALELALALSVNRYRDRRKDVAQEMEGN